MEKRRLQIDEEGVHQLAFDAYVYESWIFESLRVVCRMSAGRRDTVLVRWTSRMMHDGIRESRRVAKAEASVVDPRNATRGDAAFYTPMVGILGVSSINGPTPPCQQLGVR